ncbi:hypothetical protein N0V88_005265 [Collariella sp. IMI 366227]|nr:hypothetical protein N0V88_005265 [Collariella sp. IMI 366227]
MEDAVEAGAFGQADVAPLGAISEQEGAALGVLGLEEIVGMVQVRTAVYTVINVSPLELEECAPASIGFYGTGIVDGEFRALLLEKLAAVLRWARMEAPPDSVVEDLMERYWGHDIKRRFTGNSYAARVDIICASWVLL